MLNFGVFRFAWYIYIYIIYTAYLHIYHIFTYNYGDDEPPEERKKG